jgi:bacterioferritin
MQYLNMVVDIDRRASDHIGWTSAYGDREALPLRVSADRQIVHAMLNEVLATELVCVLRYRRYYFVNEGFVAEEMKHRFLAYAKTEQEHADSLAERIVQLGGAPHFDPSDLAVRSQSKFNAGKTLHDMVGEDLLFVRMAIESYTDMMSYLKNQDRTTVRMLDWILTGQIEQGAELTAFFYSLPTVMPQVVKTL